MIDCLFIFSYMSFLFQICIIIIGMQYVTFVNKQSIQQINIDNMNSIKSCLQLNIQQYSLHILNKYFTYFKAQ